MEQINSSFMPKSEGSTLHILQLNLYSIRYLSSWEQPYLSISLLLHSSVVYFNSVSATSLYQAHSNYHQRCGWPFTCSPIIAKGRHRGADTKTACTMHLLLFHGLVVVADYYIVILTYWVKINGYYTGFCLVHGFHRSVKIRGSDVQGVKGEDRLNVDGVAKNLELY